MTYDDIVRCIYDLSQIIVKIKKSNFYKEQYEKFLLNWKEGELENIFKTGGRNINNAMKPKKNNPNWFKFRKFPAPSQNLLGIWTGETRYALVRGFKVGNKIEIFKRISNNKLQYGYKAKYKSKDITKYINVNIGISEKFMNEEANRIADIIIEMMEDIRNKYV